MESRVLSPRARTIGNGLGLLGVATAIAACGAPPPTAATSPPATSPSLQREYPGPHARLTFDWRNGNSKIIQVYPGVGTSDYDKTNDGTYYTGQTVTVACQTTGREVHDVPPEQPAGLHSAIWYLLQTAAGSQPQFATAVYATVSTPPGATIPQCVN